MLGVSRSIGPYGCLEAVLFRRCFIQALFYLGMGAGLADSMRSLSQ